MTKNLIRIDYPFDEEKLLKEFNMAIEHNMFEAYTDERYDSYFNGLQATCGLENHPEFEYANEVTDHIRKEFNITGRMSPRFYTLYENAILRSHVDIDTECEINHVLKGDDAGLFFGEYTGDNTEQYKTALLNTAALHGVKNKSQQRVLFKISIFNEKFESVAKKIDSIKKI